MATVRIAINPKDAFEAIVAAAGTPTPTLNQGQWFLDQFGSLLRICNVLGLSTAADILATLSAIGAQHAVIDSLMALDISGYDWEPQRNFARRLVGAARISGSHVHLVVHLRKPMTGDQVPDVHDIAGSSDIGRLVDNVLFIRRRSDEAVDARSTPMQIQVRKQRNFTGACPVFQGWFHREFMQYHAERFPAGAVRYLPDAAYRHSGS